MSQAENSSLNDEQYQLIVAPALQVTAELAAVRGDPELYNDLASMLVMRALIKAFGALYLEDGAHDTVTRDAIAAAPDAASSLVLQRAELTEQQFRECLWALDAAAGQLGEDIFAGLREAVLPAWQALQAGNREQAVARLKFAAGNLAGDIDKWEYARDAANNKASA